MLKRFAKDRSGATASEYGLIAVLIACGAIGGMATFSDSFNAMFTNMSGAYQRAIGTVTN